MVLYAEMSNLQKLTYLRDKVAEIYRLEASDEFDDNGNLSQLNNAILNINSVLRHLKIREEKD